MVYYEILQSFDGACLLRLHDVDNGYVELRFDHYENLLSALRSIFFNSKLPSK